MKYFFITNNYKYLLVIFIVISSTFTYSADPVKGRKHYRIHCAMCHGETGSPAMPLAANFRRGEGLLKPDTSLVGRIEAGKNNCPAYRGILKREQIFDVIAYLRTLY